MGTKRRPPTRPAAPPSDARVDDAWRNEARDALKDAIGDNDALLLVEEVSGAPPRVVVALSIAAPRELVGTLRDHPPFEELVERLVTSIRVALGRALRATEVELRLVPAAIETTREMLGLALDVAGRGDIADALSLPPSSERNAPSDGEPGRSFEVTRLRIQQIEATSLRRLAVSMGRALPPRGALIPDPERAAPLEPPARETNDDIGDEPRLPPDDRLDWLPVASLSNESAKPRFWLIARCGRVISVRQGQRMRSLAEKRYEHGDEARARADFDARLSKRLAAGWRDIQLGSLETAVLYHEDLVPEMDRTLVQTAARALLALDTWRGTLSAQALVRALAGGTACELALARRLVDRIQATEILQRAARSL